eukprot:gene4924-5167_t
MLHKISGCRLKPKIGESCFKAKLHNVLPAPLKTARNGHVAQAGQATNGRIAPLMTVQSSQQYLTMRHQDVLAYYPTALGVDDFIARVEVVLCGFGFTGSNSIAVTNLCRDEVTTVLKDKIEAVFGSCFNTNGLGAVLTCGLTGIQAGLSHSPVSPDERERYVFFSFPHVAIDSNGTLGAIYRSNRPGLSCACGALKKALIELQAEGLTRNAKIPGVHDPLDPEFTILKQRLARRIRYEQGNVRSMDLAQLTEVAERVITDDLEYMIEKCVSIDKADFAVVAGIQIHNWVDAGHSNEPNLEFIAPTKVYVVVGGELIMLDIMQLPPLAPRQMSLLARHSSRPGETSPAEQDASEEAAVSNGTVNSTLVGISSSALAKRMGGSATSTLKDVPHYVSRLPRGRSVTYANGNSNGHAGRSHQADGGSQGPTCTWPGWQTKIQKLIVKKRRDPLVPTMDGSDSSPHTSFTSRGVVN